MRFYALGGYNEVGKNMSAVEIGNEVVIIDMGLQIDKLIQLEGAEGAEEYRKTSTKKLIEIGALPNDAVLHSALRGKRVAAIVISHAHLDHSGAIPRLAEKYKCPIIATPYTCAVIKKILHDEGLEKAEATAKLKKSLLSLSIGERASVSKNFEVELVRITHSTPQAAMPVLHTPEGAVAYLNDYKLDNTPTLGDKPDYKRYKQLGKKGVKLLILESIRAAEAGRTPSEYIAKIMVKDAIERAYHENTCVAITTYASHIARIKAILAANRGERRVALLGRSLLEYVEPAKEMGFLDTSDVELFAKRRKAVGNALEKIRKKREEWLIIATGHQGEPNAVLSRIARGEYKFRFQKEDQVIFSSEVVPNPINIANRYALHRSLKEQGVRIFDNIHVSVLPSTRVLVKENDKITLKEIAKVPKKVIAAGFDPKDFRIKWFDSKLIKHDYNGKIFTIKTKSGRSVDVTSGHSLFILKNGRIKEVTGDNLKKDDYVVIPKYLPTTDTEYIDVSEQMDLSSKHYKIKNGWVYYNDKKIILRKIKLTPEFCRLLGYYLAEGSAPRHVTLTFGKHEKEIIKDAIKCIKSTFPANISVSKRQHAVDVTFGAKIVGGLFKKWFGSGAKNKGIPCAILSTTSENKKQFLAAYLAGDASLDRGKRHFRIRVKTASKTLASDLLYLLSQLGICGKFDHIEKIPPRKIGQLRLKASKAYVIRIQGVDSLEKIYKYIPAKFRIPIADFLKNKERGKKYPPETLPLCELDLAEINAKKGTYLDELIKYNPQRADSRQHVAVDMIKRDANFVGNPLSKLIKSGLLFDPIVKIRTKKYKGPVHDLSVPRAQNFVGGFGGIVLHNSGHARREDDRDMIRFLKPKFIFPSHGETEKLASLASLAEEEGYKIGKTVQVLYDGAVVDI